MAQAEIGDDSIETKSVDQGHPDLGGPESTPNFSTPESENLGSVRGLEPTDRDVGGPVITAGATDRAALPPSCHASDYHAEWRPSAWSACQRSSRSARDEARSGSAAASSHIDPLGACSPRRGS